MSLDLQVGRAENSLDALSKKHVIQHILELKGECEKRTEDERSQHMMDPRNKSNTEELM